MSDLLVYLVYRKKLSDSPELLEKYNAAFDGFREKIRAVKKGLTSRSSADDIDRYNQMCFDACQDLQDLARELKKQSVSWFVFKKYVFLFIRNKNPPQINNDTNDPIGDASPIGSILSGNILLKSNASGILTQNDDIALWINTMIDLSIPQKYLFKQNENATIMQSIEYVFKYCPAE